MAGDNKREEDMPGHHRLLLALYKKIYPQASNGACAVFIATHSDDNRVFTDNGINRALKDMSMPRKKASTFKDSSQHNLQLHHKFWNNFWGNVEYCVRI